ncbi:MAG: hypothetical protein ACRDRP_01030 [Pseudonocardiaceae bacterium]
MLTENAPPRIAANRGYAMTTGDMVVFLDRIFPLEPGVGDAPGLAVLRESSG